MFQFFVNQRLIAAVDFVAWMQQREIPDRHFPGFHFIASGLRLLGFDAVSACAVRTLRLLNPLNKIT